MMKRNPGPTLRRGGCALLAAASLLPALPAPAAAGQCQSSCMNTLADPIWRIGGSAEGFLGGGLELILNDGQETLVVEQPGAFRYRRRLRDTQLYAVTVRRHPIGRHCTVGNGQGAALSHVNNVEVECGLGRVGALLPPAQGEGANAGPLGPLLVDEQLNLYALAANGGLHGYGAVMRIAPDGQRQVLHSFTVAREVEQTYRLTFSADRQYLYGISQRGGEHNGGAIFRLRRDGSSYQTLHSFGGPGGASVPSSPLLLAGDGRFYGVTASGGAQQGGTLYRWDPDAGCQVLHAFSKPDSQENGMPRDPQMYDPQRGLFFPTGALAEGPNGMLYGVTAFGGAHGSGGVFAYRRTDAQLVTLASLPAGCLPPLSGLTRARNGDLYGLTITDEQARTTLFRVTPRGELSRYLLEPGQSGIARPRGLLVQGRDGLLYGTSSGGGRRGYGTVFALDPDAAQLSVLFSFGSNAGEIGAAPEHGVVLTANGDVYGTTHRFGQNGQGAVFRID